MKAKSLIKKVLGLEDWESINGLEKPRAVYSLVKARRLLMQHQYPRWVIVELTTRCNSKCTYCPRVQLVKEKRLSPNRFLPVISYLGFMRKLRKINPCFSGQFIFGGMGEPTLHPGFADVLEATKTLFPKCETVLMTNSITLKAMAKALINNLDVLSVSLNTFDKETYRRLNGVDIFNKVVDNIEYFLGKKGDRKPATKVQILVMDANRSIYRKFKDHWTPKLNWNDSLTYERFHNFVGQITVSDYSSTSFRSGLKPCLELFESLYVLSNGNLYPCCAGAVADCMPNNGGLLIGNVREDLKGIFSGKRLTRVRELHKRDMQNKILACAKCDMWKGKANAFIKFNGKWR